MPKPLVIAYHLIWTAYGWWLPNDPRGSGSKTVRNASLEELGDLHYGRRANQPPRHEVREFYDRARPRLRHPLLQLTGDEVTAAARGLAHCIAEHNYTCYAAAIMPDHVHLIIRKHKHSAEEILENLQALSRERLIFEGLRDSDHPVWTAGGWKRFLDRPTTVRRVMAYIQNNPREITQSIQQWPFVTTYNDWPLYPGHSPNSPYAQRLR